MESPDPFLSRPVQNFSATDEIEIKVFTIQFLLLDRLSSSFRKREMQVQSRSEGSSSHSNNIHMTESRER